MTTEFGSLEAYSCDKQYDYYYSTADCSGMANDTLKNTFLDGYCPKEVCVSVSVCYILFIFLFFYYFSNDKKKQKRKKIQKK